MRRSFFLACAVMLVASAPSHAADLFRVGDHGALPPAVEAGFGSGWYLRGDVGVSASASKNPANPRLDARFPNERTEFLNASFAAAPVVGLGVGYRLGMLRVDATGEYRGRTPFRALERLQWPGAGDWNQTNRMLAYRSEWLGLVNAYLDLGTWYGVTPFVGAGIGAARVTIGGFEDHATVFPSPVSMPALGVSYAQSASRTTLAFALHAGASYAVTPAFEVEIGYRYLHLGEARTGETFRFDGTSQVSDQWIFRGLHSHDVRLGMRWNLGADQAPTRTPPLARAF